MKKSHTDPAYDDDLQEVRGLLQQMSNRTEEMLSRTLVALASLDTAEAKRIIAADGEVNKLEVACDERCLKVLARWQPVASDLRFIAAALKVVTDLERIGDHCVNVGQSLLELKPEPSFEPPLDLASLGGTAQTLLRDALEALAGEDVGLAAQVIERSHRVDSLVRDVLRSCFDAVRQDGNRLSLAVRLHEIAGYLQRIAAHATNIAEMVIFLVRGEDVRHGRDVSPAATAVGGERQDPQSIEPPGAGSAQISPPSPGNALARQVHSSDRGGAQ
jgi:phosphate transport system protein